MPGSGFPVFGQCNIAYLARGIPCFRQCTPCFYDSWSTQQSRATSKTLWGTTLARAAKLNIDVHAYPRNKGMNLYLVYTGLYGIDIDIQPFVC